MPKDKRMWDNILTVIMSLLCLLWIYPIVLIAEQPENGRHLHHFHRLQAAYG